jgi:hypothetical protein
MSRGFVKQIEAFAEREGIDVVTFRKGERKDDIARASAWRTSSAKRWRLPRLAASRRGRSSDAFLVLFFSGTSLEKTAFRELDSSLKMFGPQGA